MVLLLTSQGLPPELKETFLRVIPKSPHKLNVAFITTAAYGDNAKRPEWLDVNYKQLQNYGITEIEELDIRYKTKQDLEKILEKKDIIFINGGNTFFLLFWIRKTGLDTLIPQLIHKGKLYIGVSAGSYIACPNIEQATWKHQDRNRFGVTDLTALNLVPFLITAHFNEEYRPILEKAIKTVKFPVVALYDTQAILVKDGKWKLEGKGNKEFFNNFQETL
ncbi:Type 1 glutamine amidotransferase-like domain-containing protein [Candidatus Gottesmanbacteria bacterium]|nr:Type 1 glutamine amidotransferase-like domain-containing protein [Candidatus Gottesmanbacteria bacterium]